MVAAVLAAEACHGGVAFGGHVFHPLGKFFDGAATYVSADVGFAAQHFAEVEEFVRAEAVVFDGAAPVVVHHLRAVLFRADAVHPVVFVGKAAARPAEDGDFQLLQGIEHVGAITVGIGNVGAFAYPEPAVDAGAQVFGKLAVDFFRDDLRALVGMQGDCCTLLGRCGKCGCQEDTADDKFVSHGYFVFIVR